MNFIDSKFSPFCNYIFQDENKNTFNNIYQYYLYKKFNTLTKITEMTTLLQMSNNRREPIIKNWDNLKYNIMLDGYIISINKNPALKKIITSPFVYCDDVPVDLTFWKKKFSPLVQEILYLINMNRLCKLPETKLPETKIPETKLPVKSTKYIIKSSTKIVFNDDDNIIY